MFAYISSNGVVSFGSDLVSAEPNLTSALGNKNKLIAPFWSRVDPARGRIYFHVYEKCDGAVFSEPSPYPNSTAKERVMARAAKDVMKYFNLYDIDVTNVMVVTWRETSPLVPSVVGLTEKNSFQTIYVSGYRKESAGDLDFSTEETAYVITIYQKGQMNWKFVAGRPLEVGAVASPFTSVRRDVIDELTFDLTKNRANYREVIYYQVGRKSSPAQLCQRYLCRNSYLIQNSVYREQTAQMPLCPCTQCQVGREWVRFDRDNQPSKLRCYSLTTSAKKKLFNNPRNNMCCYMLNSPSPYAVWSTSPGVASIVHNSPDAGHILTKDPWWSQGARETTLAHQTCCKDSNRSRLCDRFYKIFPDRGCALTSEFIRANVIGDPHIITLDNFFYTMNGYGVYTMIDVISAGFSFQARTDQVKTTTGATKMATVFGAFAAKEKDYARFQVEISTGKFPMVILVNGVNITEDFYNNTRFVLSLEAIDVRRDEIANRTSVVAVFPCGVTLAYVSYIFDHECHHVIGVTLAYVSYIFDHELYHVTGVTLAYVSYIFDHELYHVTGVTLIVDPLTLSVEVHKSLQNKTSGLMGNFNGRADDDFTLPNGTVLRANLTEKEIIKNFASQYLVTDATSVFILPPGKNISSYQHPEFTPFYSESASLSSKMAAASLCGATNKACIYDYLATGDKVFASRTKALVEQAVVLRQTLANNCPTVTFASDNGSFQNGRWYVQEGVASRLQIRADDSDKDALTFLLFGNPVGVTINQTGHLSYTPTLANPAQVAFQVKDSKDCYTPIEYVPVTICPLCDGNGECDNSSIRDVEYFGGKVQILRCLCQPGYTGM
ncbi:mucin-like protein [Physella acuta]|uniref:mucin-like protein n=1 Tax=Physella acuta TaxID=109671 RepID=UPI0027DDAEDE|nr:mucin-like protein [Physella acuta]